MFISVGLLCKNLVNSLYGSLVKLLISAAVVDCWVAEGGGLLQILPLSSK